MSKEPQFEGLASNLLASEEAQDAVISAIRNGQITQIDGVMSPISVALSSRLDSTLFDMNSWWVKTPQNWICPACGRGKIDLARLNTKAEIMCHLVEHHDHMKDLLKRRFQEISVNRKEVVADELAEKFAKRSATMVSAYENTIICVDCNNADAQAKKAAKTKSDFSFSPNELLRIIKSESNRPHKIDVDVAKAVWAEQQDTFELRMKIVDRIAGIAASNEHWFQPGDNNCNPELIDRWALAYVHTKGAYGVLAVLSGSMKPKAARPASAWRQTALRPPGVLPPPNEIEHAGKVGNPKLWKALDDWICPGCHRNKRDIVRKNKDGEWAFPVGKMIFFDVSSPRGRREIFTCADCMKVAQELGKEAVLRVGKEVQGYGRLVNIEEVRRCVISSPHTRHNIDNDTAELVLEDIEVRLLQGREEAE